MIYDISFEEYYSEDRIQRLARGLLIFLFNHGKMILRMPLFAMLRFVVFKYLKLLLPFAILLFCLAALLMFYSDSLPDFFSWLFIAIAFSCLIEPVRKLQIHFLRVNYNFMIATIKFLFFNHRSNKWNKLKVPKAT